MAKRKTKTKKSKKTIKKTKKVTKKLKPKLKITKNMKFSEVLTKYPRSAEIMTNYGLHCIGCQVAAFETIQQGAKAHGMTTKQLNNMINDLNKIVSEKKIEYKRIEPIPEEKTLTVKEPIEKPKKKSFLKRLFGG